MPIWSPWLEVTIGKSTSNMACWDDRAAMRFRQASQIAKTVTQLHSISESFEPILSSSPRILPTEILTWSSFLPSMAIRS